LLWHLALYLLIPLGVKQAIGLNFISLNKSKKNMKRRSFIGTTAAASIGIIACKSSQESLPEKKEDFKLKNNINHSVCHWCFNTIPLEDF
tara:strand:+ start:24872 stop:25141 length:270 start_codon:yes stop_codon:yes gene_type:complete